MSYLDIGFDENLMRVESTPQSNSQELDPLAFDSFTQQISGSKVQGGVISSPDGKTKFDIENGVFKVNNGMEDLVSLGLLSDGSYGLLIKNNEGKILMQVTSDVILLQSPNENFQADFIEERILAKDDKGLPRALFGKGKF